MLKASLKDAERLGVLQQNVGGSNVFQFAADQVGTMDAGILLAKVCLGGEAEVLVFDPAPAQITLPHIAVTSNNPLVECIGCQYAGWPLSAEDFTAMASGPIRLLRGSESVLEQYNLKSTENQAVIVLESPELPTEAAVAHIAEQAGVTAENLFICVANTSSLPGSAQVVARSVETAMHKLHEIGFDLATVIHGQATAPMPPITDSDLIAMGRTNDAILYGARVELSVDTTDETIATVIDQIPSSSSEQFGKPFLTIFNEAGRDFYKIDPLLFAPAEIVISNARSSNLFSAGKLRLDVLQASFGV